MKSNHFLIFASYLYPKNLFLTTFFQTGYIWTQVHWHLAVCFVGFKYEVRSPAAGVKHSFVSARPSVAPTHVASPQTPE